MLGEEPRPEIPKPPHELVDPLRRGGVVALVGSGFSCAAGLPGWSEILQALCDEGWRTRPARRQEIASAWKAITTHPPHAMRILQDVLGPEFVGAVGRQILTRRRFLVDLQTLEAAERGDGQEKPWMIVEGPTPVDPQPTTGHRMLLRLGIPRVVTSSYDDLLERAIDPPPEVQAWSHAELPELPTAGTPTILKLRGDLRQLQGEFAADHAHRSAPAGHPANKPLFQRYQPLWIGHEHDDIDLDVVLGGLRSLDETEGVAIVSGAASSLRRRFRGVARIIIELPRHADMQRFLQELALAVERPVSFAVRFAARCTDERAAKRLVVRLEDLLDGYGVRTSVWSARPDAESFLLEAAPPDFRALRGLLQRREQTLLEKFTALGITVCDEVEITPRIASARSAISEPRPASKSIATESAPVPPSVAVPVPVYVPSGSPVTAVAELLARLFSPEELRAWVLGFAGSDVCNDIEFVGSPRAVALRAAEVLQRHGFLSQQLIEALRSARPQRVQDIEALVRFLFPAPAGADATWDSYTLFSRLLDRDAAWSKLLHACDSKNDPVVFVLHGTPSQNLALFMDRTHRFLDDEARDGVRREHQVFEVLFERDFVRLQTAEEWEASFRRAMGFARGKPLADYLQRALTQHALMFLIRGKDAAPLANLNATEREALAEFLRVRLPAILATLRPPNRALRFLIAIEHTTPRVHQDELFKTIDDALRAASGAERKLLELRFPTLDEVLESVEKFLNDRRQPVTIEIRDRCTSIYERHEALGDAKNYRDLADDLYRELSPKISAPRA